MSKILIVSALELETNNQLKEYQVLHTGVGKINATYNLTETLLLDCYDLVINYGTAGSKVYTGLVDCTKFAQRDMDASPLGFKKGETPYENYSTIIDFSHIKNPINHNLCCYTGDSFATNLSKYDGVVDMEAYALAKTCRNLEVNFVSYKYISDNGNADDWKQNCSKGVNEFKKVLKYYDNI